MCAACQQMSCVILARETFTRCKGCRMRPIRRSQECAWRCWFEILCWTARAADTAARGARRRTRRWWRRRARCCACTRSASACACSATARGARRKARRCAACARATTRRAQALRGQRGTGACSPRQGSGVGVAVQPSSPGHEAERRPAGQRLWTARHALCGPCCIGFGARPPAHEQ